jgi:PST family polysaccharide transporter
MWTAASVLLMRLGNIGAMAVVARLVAPSEFGVFAIALTVHAMVTSVAELGLASAVARSDLEADAIGPTVTSIAIGAGLAAACGTAAAAAPLAAALGSPAAANPLRVLAINVAFVGIFAVPGARLQREFRQRVVFRCNMIAFVPSTIVLIAGALQGHGAMAFAWSRVGGQVTVGLLMMHAVRPNYRPGWDASKLRMLLRFGLPLAGANLLSQALLNVDYLLVARALGTEALGYYAIAFNVASWSNSLMGSVLNSIVMPAFSKIRERGGDIRAALYTATRLVFLISSPIGLLTLALAHPLIATVYGSKWLAAAGVLAVLAVYGVMFVACLLYANVIIASGRTGVLFWVQVLALMVLTPALWLGIRLYGARGAGLAHIIVILVVTLPAYLVSVVRTTDAGLISLVRAAGAPLVAALVAAIAAWGATTLFDPNPVRLAVGGLVGGGAYVLAAAGMAQQILPERWRRASLVNGVSAPGRVVSRGVRVLVRGAR